MIPYLITMFAGGAVLWFNPWSGDHIVRKTSTALAGLVFAIGLIGVMTQLAFAGS